MFRDLPWWILIPLAVVGTGFTIKKRVGNLFTRKKGDTSSPSVPDVDSDVEKLDGP